MHKTIFTISIFLAATFSATGQWLQNGSNTYYINGNVGIGTTTPNYTLDVSRPGGANKISVYNTIAWNPANTGYSEIAATTYYAGNIGIIANRNGATINGIPDHGLGLYTSWNDLIISTGPNDVNVSEKMRVTTSGNVGIGTTTPQAKLDVIGSNNTAVMKATLMPMQNESGLTGIIVNDASNNGNLTALNIQRNGTPKFWVSGQGNVFATGDIEIGRGDGHDTKLRFHNYNSSWYSVGIDMSDGRFKINAGANLGDATHLAMDWNGNVGIGTASPQSKLAVNGTITAKEIIVSSTGWSDFVFDENYKLKSLNEVEEFIKANKHLPEIPNAKMVEENGVAVGEMQSKLLQKIEELTLYVIELKKEIQQLQENKTQE